MLHKRLAHDYETLAASSKVMIHVASIDNLTKRITDGAAPTWRGTYSSDHRHNQRGAMAIDSCTVQLTGQEPCPGIEEALGWTDAWQVRRGATWLVTRRGEDVAVRRAGVAEVPVFFPDPTGDLRGYASPAPDARALAVCGDAELAVVETDGTIRWSHLHDPWSADGGSGRGACAFTADGRHVVAIAPGMAAAPGEYQSDLLVTLAAADGTVVATAPLTAKSGIYEIRQPLNGPDILLVSAGQGQDEALSYAIALDGAALRIVSLDTKDEPITDLDEAAGQVLTAERGGAWITLHRLGPDLDLATSGQVRLEDLVGENEELRFVGRPVFVDDSLFLAAIAEEEWTEEFRHFLIDTRIMRPVAELEYPLPVNADTIPLGNGVWLTGTDDELCRWTLRRTGS
ncbi:hypothetical protein GCM10022403_061760 [Streptomyces coacervatus]|uniref:PQQ-binding-like beta-propeller repeat protein n=1 Tax=Streptomyces coacervatus TaxID=647381 RepID=A0ABP7IJ88_9ACTN